VIRNIALLLALVVAHPALRRPRRQVPRPSHRPPSPRRRNRPRQNRVPQPGPVSASFPMSATASLCRKSA
jgi:hypothetical protein